GGPFRRPQVSDSTRQFRSHGLSGRRWRSTDLRAKVTFVDIWATSCGACREHPEIQRFYEIMKIKSDVHVLTFSMHDDPHRVESYMKEHKYTFPVIVGGELVQKMFLADGGIPQSWII